MTDGDDMAVDPFRRGWLANWLAEFAIEAMRSIARGDDTKSGDALLEVFGEVAKHGITRGELLDEWRTVVSDLHARIAPPAGPSHSSDHLSEVVRASLQLLAERRCGDPAAKARASARSGDLFAAIEALNRYRAKGGV